MCNTIHFCQYSGFVEEIAMFILNQLLSGQGSIAKCIRFYCIFHENLSFGAFYIHWLSCFHSSVCYLLLT